MVRAQCSGTDLSLYFSEDIRERMDDLLAGEPYQEGRFFEVARDGHVSTLFGTLHLSDADVAVPPADLVARLTAADSLFIEVTAEEEARMTVEMMTNPGLLMAPQGASLERSLGADDWAALTQALGPYGFSPQMADIIAPWFLTTLLATPPCLLRQQAAGGVILDRQIETAAAQAGVPITGLETFDEVFDLFAAMTYEEQVNILRITLPSVALAEDYLATTRAMYIRNEIQAIRAYGIALVELETPHAAATNAVGTFYETLLTVRNAQWMDDLLPALGSGTHVVAVGALHLGGSDGLLALLESEGFRVTRLDGP